MTDKKVVQKLHIGEKLRIIRKDKGLTQTEFGRKIGLAQSYVADLERGRNKPSFDTLAKIMRVFCVNPYWLLSPEEYNVELPPIVAEPRTEYNQKKLIAIPVINDVPAGYPEYPVMDDEIRDHVYLPRVPKQAFGLYVSGDSMKPEINNGDIVIVNPNIQEVKKGEIGVFRINAETTVKYCVPLDDGFLLQPANPSYKPILVSGDIECAVIGKVIYKIVKC